MRLTLPYASTEEVTVSSPAVIRLPQRLGFAVLKTRQLLCSHDWKEARNIKIFGNHSIKVNRCCKCKKKQINSVK